MCSPHKQSLARPDCLTCLTSQLRPVPSPDDSPVREGQVLSLAAQTVLRAPPPSTRRALSGGCPGGATSQQNAGSIVSSCQQTALGDDTPSRSSGTADDCPVICLPEWPLRSTSAHSQVTGAVDAGVLAPSHLLRRNTPPRPTASPHLLRHQPRHHAHDGHIHLRCAASRSRNRHQF